MRRSALTIAFGLPLLGMVAVVLAWPSEPRRRYALSGGGEMCVRHVSLGTNHFFSAESVWKRLTRRVLPSQWQYLLGPTQGESIRTLHESLVVWMETFDAKDGTTRAIRLQKPEAVWSNGASLPGTLRTSQSRLPCFEFPSFDRGAHWVNLRLRDGTNVLDFAVSNPRPSQFAAWTARPRLQTNLLQGTAVVLREQGNRSPFAFGLQAKGLGEDKTGWISWRLTVFDPWGNWTEQNWTSSRSGPPSVSLLPPGGKVWKLVAKGKEYVSAGFVPNPTQGSVVLLPPNPRTWALGVRMLVWAGPGIYEIIDGHVTRAEDLPDTPPEIARTELIADSSEVVWGLRMTVLLPSIVLVVDEELSRIQLSARLRERIDVDDGRIFLTLQQATSTRRFQGEMLTVQNWAPRISGFTPTNLEVELIYTLPPAEFYVPAPL